MPWLAVWDWRIVQRQTGYTGAMVLFSIVMAIYSIDRSHWTDQSTITTSNEYVLDKKGSVVSMCCC